jgi:hypothetical protein
MLDNMILAEGKALSVLSHLVEGCSIRSTERLTQVHRDTILDLLNVAGMAILGRRKNFKGSNSRIGHDPHIAGSRSYLGA